MVHFTVDQMRALMEQPEQIRNMAVIAHVDHGKSTLTDSLVAAAGIIKQEDAGEKRATDTLDAEKERGITIMGTAVSMHFNVNAELAPDVEDAKRDFVINLIDCPGHVDFSSEVTAALRVTDGALVVVDCVEGVCVQTETVLRQAMTERIKPVLFLNKVDRFIRELQLDPEEAYQSFQRTIDTTGVTIDQYADPAMGELELDPTKGNVAFGSGYHGWAFSLPQFARVYAKKFGGDPAKLTQRLWGDNFYDAKNRKWLKRRTNEQGESLKRAFCEFCLAPIYQVVNAVMDEDKERLAEMLGKLQITLTAEELSWPGKKQLRAVMKQWLPASDALLSVIVSQLPSPQQAQKYRTELIFNADKEHEHHQAITKCSSEGPLVCYVSKMVASADKGRFFAFGRVFSGTAKAGNKVNVMGTEFTVGGTKDFHHTKQLQRTMLSRGRVFEAVDSVPAGNLCLLVGIDNYILKSGTIVDGDVPMEKCASFREMKFTVSAVVRRAVECVNPADLPKFVKGLQQLAAFDLFIKVFREESGEHIVAGAGELHLEVCLDHLRNTIMPNVAFRVLDPIVPFRETVTVEGPTGLSKSANRHNRVWGTAAPLTDELTADIDDGNVGFQGEDAKQRHRFLQDKHSWDGTEAKKVWCFGPDNSGPNIVVDGTKGVQNMDELKDSVVAAWQWSSNEGPMTDEPMRGIKCALTDVQMHADKVHRGPTQMIPSARRLFYGCTLTASPRLVEPIYEVDVQTVTESIGAVYNVLLRHRGEIVGEVPREGTSIVNIKAYLPVADSFGLTASLRAATGGRAFPQCSMHHWQQYPGDPLEAEGAARDVLTKIRQRKGLKAEMPKASAFLDTL